MKALRRLGLLVGAMLVLGAFAAVPAMAADGTGTIVVDDGGDPGEPCDVTFTYNGSIPGNGSLSNIADDDCELDGFPIDLDDSNLNASFSGGNASLSGTVTVTVFGAIQCSYSGTLTGTYTGGPPWNYTISGTVTADPGNSFLCPPGPLAVSITGTIS